jgi:membrane protease YdiL (CAAX protease family)
MLLLIPGHSPSSRIRPLTLIGYGIGLGAAMLAAAIVIHGGPSARWFPPGHWCGSVATGAGIGGLFAAGVWRLLEPIPSLRRMEQMLVAALDMEAFRYRHALLLSLIAGLPEEILFRGALQPALGWLPTSILFGTLHAITPAYFVYATAAGGLLGGLAIWQNGLWAPVAAHVVIDALMFGLLIRRGRSRRRVG